MMSNTFILVDEALLSRLKEFVIKEISLSLSHTHITRSVSINKAEDDGHPARGLTKENRVQPLGIRRGWSIQSADVLRGGISHLRGP